MTFRKIDKPIRVKKEKPHRDGFVKRGGSRCIKCEEWTKSVVTVILLFGMTLLVKHALIALSRDWNVFPVNIVYHRINCSLHPNIAVLLMGFGNPFLFALIVLWHGSYLPSLVVV